MAIITENALLDCWDQAVHCFGTAYIFDCRAKKLKSKLTLLQFFGIISPLLVGSIIISFGTSFKYISYLLALTGIVSIIQLIFAVWALVDKWDDKLSYDYESATSNYRLSASFERLGKNGKDQADSDFEYKLLLNENERRNESDYKQGISESEKRLGMRASLRKFQRKCSGCNTIPVSMEPSKCEICGNF